MDVYPRMASVCDRMHSAPQTRLDASVKGATEKPASLLTTRIKAASFDDGLRFEKKVLTFDVTEGLAWMPPITKKNHQCRQFGYF